MNIAANKHELQTAYLSPTLVNGLDGVRVDERAEGIEVRDVLLAQSHAVAPVQRADVILYAVI